MKYVCLGYFEETMSESESFHVYRFFLAVASTNVFNGGLGLPS
jgi:hypothetical protein